MLMVLQRLRPALTVVVGGVWLLCSAPFCQVGAGGSCRLTKTAGIGTKVVVVFVPIAFRRLWELLGDDKWIVFTGFTALILAAVSEFSIPNFLADSILSAQSGYDSAFDRNSRMLLFLCAIGGICRTYPSLIMKQLVI